MTMAGETRKPDPHLDLTVKSTSGSFRDQFNRNNKAEKVLDEAIRRLRLDPDPPMGYVLRRESDGLVLTLSEKLGDLGIQDGDVILLQTPQAQDG
jgi:hypothetical protein